MSYELRRTQKVTLNASFLAVMLFVFFLLPIVADAATIGRPSNNLGLVGYWDFDVGKGGDTAYDRSGNRNDGTLTNMDLPTDWVDGKIGQGLDFDGSDDYVEAGGNDDFTFGTNGSMTVAAWVKLDGVQSESFEGNTIASAVAKGAIASSNPGFGIFLRNESSAFQIRDVDENVVQIDDRDGSTNINDGQWHHVVGVLDRSVEKIRLYTDGVSEGIQDSSSVGSLDNVNIKARIGNRSSSDDKFHFDGKIDSARIYDRALSPGEVERLYKLGESKWQQVAAMPAQISTDLIAHWTFNKEVTTSVTTSDVSGLGYDGTLNGPHKNVGYYGTGLTFDGSNDYITIPGSASSDFDVRGSNFTIGAWFKTDATTDGTILAGQDAANDPDSDHYILNIKGTGEVRFSFSPGQNDQQIITSSDTYNDGFWHHAAAIRTGARTGELFVDGKLVAQDTNNSGSWGGIDINNYDVNIGRLPADKTNKFNGVLDDIRFYTRAFSANEVKTLYNSRPPITVNSSFTDRLTDGLVGHWTFDGDVTNANTTKDVSGNGNNGTLTNGPAPTIGKLGQALEFDGADDYVSTGSMLNDVDTGTISMWVRWNGTQDESYDGYGPVVARQKDGSWNTVLQLTDSDPNTGVLDWHFRGSVGSGNDLIGSTPPGDGVWRHVVATFQPSEHVLYLDGRRDAAGSLSGTTDNDATIPLTFGAWLDDGNGYLNGHIDDIRIYNRALSEEEVQELYNMGR